MTLIGRDVAWISYETKDVAWISYETSLTLQNKWSWLWVTTRYTVTWSNENLHRYIFGQSVFNFFCHLCLIKSSYHKCDRKWRRNLSKIRSCPLLAVTGTMAEDFTCISVKTPNFGIFHLWRWSPRQIQSVSLHNEGTGNNENVTGVLTFLYSNQK